MKTVRAAKVERLQPADEVTVQILVTGERVREEKEEVDEEELRVEIVPVNRRKGRIAMEAERAGWVEMGVQLEGSEIVMRSDVDNSSWEKWEEWEDDAVSLEEHTSRKCRFDTCKRDSTESACISPHSRLVEWRKVVSPAWKRRLTDGLTISSHA